jgi:drug/metabolite transporter (DMT)-like permease
VIAGVLALLIFSEHLAPWTLVGATAALVGIALTLRAEPPAAVELAVVPGD